MRAGLQPAFSWAVYFMAALLIVIFVGFINHFRIMYYASPGDPPIVRRQSAWCVAPMWVALIALLVLGLWWPSEVWSYLIAIAHSRVGAPQSSHSSR